MEHLFLHPPLQGRADLDPRRSRGGRPWYNGKAGLRCALGMVGISVLLTSCKSPERYRGEADKVAYDIIAEGQQRALGKQEPFSIDSPAQALRKKLIEDQGLPISSPVSMGSQNLETIAQWPDKEYLTREELESDPDAPWKAPDGMMITLLEALQIAARNSREFQTQKETVFTTALRLDLQRDAFRSTWQGAIDNTLSTDLGGEETVSGVESKGSLGWSKQLQNGASLAASMGVDLVKLLTQDKSSSMGLYGDASVSIPLLRGSGRFVVTEPLTQAERDLVYAIYTFERYKKTFSVSIADEYLRVLQRSDQITTAAQNYDRLIATTRRTRRNADAGKATEVEVDQALTDELSARQQWISSMETFRRELDSFKMTLGLPLDANIRLDPNELETLRSRMNSLLEVIEKSRPIDEEEVPDADAPIILVEPSMEYAGKYEFDREAAVNIALEKRLDLRTTIGRVLDSQRKVAVAADQLRADLTLLGNGSAGASRSLGSAGEDDASFDPGNGRYSALLNIDLPLERTSERNAYRSSLISLESAIRGVQELEDRIKLDVRNGLSTLLEARENIGIQSQQLKVATRRVDSTTLQQEAGMIQIRDLLEAQRALVQAQDQLTNSIISYRMGELQIQVNMGVLEVDADGLWKEFTPEMGGDE